MSDTIVQDAVILERRLPHAPARVWQVLTEPAALARWLMPNDFAPEPGHHFTFQGNCHDGWDGRIHCVVLDAEPPRLLRYSWASGIPGGTGFAAPLETTVTWTLTPTPEGTLLRMEHRGFRPENAVFRAAVTEGWPEKLDALAGVAAG
jgi:uncharacterized protein YndB with AHSA1/START domain